MQTRSLGRTDLRFSEITLGTWGLAAGSYGPVRPERLAATVKAALDCGVTAFDCSPVWGDSEEQVGRALREAKSDALVITRAGTRFGERGDDGARGKLEHSFTEQSLVADCERSLRRFGREAIDLWLLHNPGDVSIQSDEWRGAVEQLETAGKIRAFGMSVSDVGDARLAIEAGAQAICLTYNILATENLDELSELIEESGCGILARTPLMYGLLAGQWSEGRRFSQHDHRDRRWNRAAFRVRVQQVDTLRFLVGPEHPDLATAALRFVLSHSAVTTAVLGARNPYQIGAGVDAAEGPPYLSDNDLVRIEKVRGTF